MLSINKVVLLRFVFTHHTVSRPEISDSQAVQHTKCQNVSNVGSIGTTKVACFPRLIYTPPYFRGLKSPRL